MVDLAATRAWSAGGSLELRKSDFWFFSRNSAIVFCQAVGHFGGQEEVAAVMIQPVFPDGIALVFDFDFQVGNA